jgi:Lrp/AsnC family transcriptional regulator for asnA, asnC and gidA
MWHSKIVEKRRRVAQMDELDRKIIALLQMDGRASNAKIAREVGVSEGTVRRRLRRLIQDDIVKVVAVPNLEKLGYATTALIGLQTGPGKSDAVADSISGLDEAHYVAVTTGAYDVFVWAGLESAESLGNFLRTRIGIIEGVQRTETFVNLSIKKRTYGLVL